MGVDEGGGCVCLFPWVHKRVESGTGPVRAGSLVVFAFGFVLVSVVLSMFGDDFC